MLTLSLIQFPDITTPYNVYLHNFDGSNSITFAVMKIDGVDTKQGYAIPNELPVSFQDLAQIDDATINKRMRPLLFFPGGTKYDFKFSINGHINFHHGNSENPKIGTI